MLLVVTTGDEAPRILEFGTQQYLTFGRAEPADVCVNDAGVSRVHARFVREPAGVRVIDLGSCNGTWVRGLRVTEALLAPGDCVVMGNTSILIQTVHATGRLPIEFERSEAKGGSAADGGVLASGASLNLRASLREHEAKLIREALRMTNGNQRRAAALLELPLRTFERKLRNMLLRQQAISRSAM